MNKQTYEVQINDFGGESIYVPPGTDFKTIPSDFLELFERPSCSDLRNPRDT